MWQICNSSEIIFFYSFTALDLLIFFLFFKYLTFYFSFLFSFFFHIWFRNPYNIPFCYILELWQIHRGLELDQSYCAPNVFSDLSQHSWCVYSGLHACCILQARGLSTYGTFPWNLKFTELEPLGKPVHSSLPTPVSHCELNLFHTALVYANVIILCINFAFDIFCLRFADIADK